MWDIYTNDYANLVRSEKDTQKLLPIDYEEHQSYYDGEIIGDKVINDLCWHPFWTGTVIATYTQHAKGEHLIGPKTYDEVWQLQITSKNCIYFNHKIDIAGFFHLKENFIINVEYIFLLTKSHARNIILMYYNLHKKRSYEQVFLACEGNNKVLIWSFDDCLSPKLILECPREVTSVSVCPIDSSIIIGGCINGQVIKINFYFFLICFL